MAVTRAEKRPWCFSVPARVAFGDQHAAVPDREDVYLAADRFVDDSIGFADHLTKPIRIFGWRVKADKRDCRADVGEIGEPVGSGQNFLSPFVDCFLQQIVGQFIEYAEEKSGGMRRPLYNHKAYPACCLNRLSRCARDSLATCSCGIPLPSANSRREISTSRASSMRSKRSSMYSASTRYDAARPFCVMRTGRCVSRTRAMYAERLLRHSENGTTSSDGRQRRRDRSRAFGMALSPWVSTPDIVQYFVRAVKGRRFHRSLSTRSTTRTEIAPSSFSVRATR